MSVRTPLFTGAIFAIGLAAGCGLATAIVAAPLSAQGLTFAASAGVVLPSTVVGHLRSLGSSPVSSGCLSPCSYRRCSSSIGRRTRGAAIVSPPEMDRRVCQ